MHWHAEDRYSVMHARVLLGNSDHVKQRASYDVGQVWTRFAIGNDQDVFFSHSAEPAFHDGGSDTLIHQLQHHRCVTWTSTVSLFCLLHPVHPRA